ncbi:MAG TPA: nickel pincer cofactor biosynthesis protein LarC [Planctomycetota bacterium]|nr:nickel pincer cofactor biosynthesis protein LarC [Planctomycetota bacterium]
MATLYLEPHSGMAGDMLLAALLDLGDPRFVLGDLEELAHALVPGECTLSLETAWRGNLSGKLLAVRTPESSQLPHRGYADLARIVDVSPLSATGRARAKAVLRRIAVAEATVHGTTPEEIHFHEIGAVDTLVDVCGAVFALERLAVDCVVSAPPATGVGTVRCAHGEMPVPVPAVAELLRGKPHVLGGGSGERLTPTGAAILVEIAASFEPPGAFVAERIGYGAGARDPADGPPNVLRVQLGSEVAGATSARAWLLEVNLDDVTGEELAHAARALRDAGALDVWTTPVQMKKDRPGVVLSALCRAEKKPELERVLFEETPTLGLRWTECQRVECGRRTIDVQLGGVRVRVKVRERPAYPGASPPGERDLSPEHDDLARAASAAGLSLREAERRAVAEALAHILRAQQEKRTGSSA